MEAGGAGRTACGLAHLGKAVLLADLHPCLHRTTRNSGIRHTYLIWFNQSHNSSIAKASSSDTSISVSSDISISFNGDVTLPGCNIARIRERWAEGEAKEEEEEEEGGGGAGRRRWTRTISFSNDANLG